MTSISSVSPATAPAAVTSNTSIAALAAPQPLATAASKIGPAATIDLSQAAKAHLKGDRDWKPGLPIDSF
jgi:hypothetical protein